MDCLPTFNLRFRKSRLYRFSAAFSPILALLEAQTWVDFDVVVAAQPVSWQTTCCSPVVCRGSFLLMILSQGQQFQAVKQLGSRGSHVAVPVLEA